MKPRFRAEVRRDGATTVLRSRRTLWRLLDGMDPAERAGAVVTVPDPDVDGERSETGEYVHWLLRDQFEGMQVWRSLVGGRDERKERVA